MICRALFQFEAEEEKGDWNDLEEEREEKVLEDEEESEDDELEEDELAEEDEWEEEGMEGEPEEGEGEDVLEDEGDLRRIEYGSTTLRRYVKPPFSASET